jgi:parallel beta-helix repeat protein
VRRLLREAVVCALAAGWAVPAAAVPYYVSPAGNDAATGAEDAPWRTLQKAADTVKEGDVVTVEDGAYRGFRVTGKRFGPGRVVFVARNRWKARIITPAPGSGPGDGIAIASSSYVTIDGFEVADAPRAGISVVSQGPDVTGADTRDNIVQNCWTHDSGVGSAGAGAHDGIFTGYALNVIIQGNLVERNAEHGICVSNSADNPIVRNNVIRANHAQGIQINADGALPGDGIIANWEISGNVLVENAIAGGSTAVNLDGAVRGRAFNNLIYRNGKAGFVLWRGNAGSSANENAIFNNTVYNPTGSKAALVLYTGAANNVIFNNVLYARAGGIEADGAGPGNQHDNNLLSSIAGLTRAPGESSPELEPLFASAPMNDFHPRAGSALVDRGVATFAGKQASDTDLEGRPRPQGSAMDIGCYELGTGGAPAGGAGGIGGTGGGAGGAPRPADAGDAGDGTTDPGCGCDLGAGRRAGSLTLAALAALAALGMRVRRRR